MTRSLALVLLLGGCRAPATEPPAPDRAPPPDLATERLELFEQAGLPSVLGWSRVERIVGVDDRGRPHCRRAWVQQQGAHRLLYEDVIDIDWGGLWFARWPMQLRRPANAYAGVRLPIRQVRLRHEREGQRTEIAQRPSDLLAEVTAALRGTDTCADADSMQYVTLARAGWVRALGHENLARALLVHASPQWREPIMRAELATAATRIALESLRQGMPRAQVRPMLAGAAAVCDGEPGTYAASQLALLGDDPTVPLDASDPASLSAWLAEDLVFPQTTYVPTRAREALGWPEDQVPRSPGIELVVLGWQALPVLVEGEHSNQLMRTSTGMVDMNGRIPLRTTAAVRRWIVSNIALRGFENDTQMREWWRTAKELGELDSLIATFGARGAWSGRIVERLLVLDPEAALERIDGTLVAFMTEERTSLLESLVHELWPRDRPTRLPSAAVPDLRRLLRRSAEAHSLAEVSWAIEGLRLLGDRDWIPGASARARAALSSSARVQDSDAVERMLATIARADRRRGVALLRAARRTELADGVMFIVDDVLQDLCDPVADDSLPDCGPQLREMLEESARSNR